MIKAEKEYPVEYIDCSMLCSIMRCPAKTFFSRILGLKHPDGVKIHLDYGTDMHAALPHCYAGLDHLDDACDAFNRGWVNRRHGNEDTKRNIGRARESLKNFIETHTHTNCQYEILPISKEIAAPNADRISDNEVPFAVDIGGPLPFLGRIDLPVKWKSTEMEWTLDYKTAAEVSQRYFHNFYRAPQCVGYTLAMTTLTGKDIKGMIIEAIRVSGAKDRSKAVENQLHHVWVSHQQMEEFMEMANAAARYMLSCNMKKEWPKRSTGCGPYAMFGQPGFYCEYSDLCDAADWRDVLMGYRKETPFHPFVVDRVEKLV